MDNNYEGYLKLPDFDFSEVINRKAERFCNSNFRQFSLYAPKENDKIESELYNYNNDSDRIQFLNYCINYLSNKVIIHISTCSELHCQVEPFSQEVLYYMYGKLNEFGIKIPNDLFSFDDIQKNNQIFDSIFKSLNELKAGQEVIFEEIVDVQIDLENAKNLQVLGKKKFQTYLVGVVSKIKTIQEIWSVVKPLLQLIYPDNKMLN